MGWRQARVALGALAFVTLASTGASAQTLADQLAPPAPPPARNTPGPRGEPLDEFMDPIPDGPPRHAGGFAVAGLPPDLVLTVSGGMMRGTIIRSVPGREVVIRLETGEQETVPWSDVRFAGRAEEAPSGGGQPASPAATGASVVGRGGHTVRFESDQRATLHAEAGTATATARVPGSWTAVHARASYFERLCTAPCEVSIEPGVHRLAVSEGEHDPQAATVIDIDRSGRLVGRYVDNGGLRAGGWALFVLGLLGSGGAAAAALLGVPRAIGGYANEGPPFWALMCTSGLNFLLAFVGGLPMAAAGDGAVLRFE